MWPECQEGGSHAKIMERSGEEHSRERKYGAKARRQEELCRLQELRDGQCGQSTVSEGTDIEQGQGGCRGQLLLDLVDHGKEQPGFYFK